MNSLTLNEINKMSVDERIQLAQTLWDSIPETTEELPLTTSQKQELTRRLAEYRNNPAIGDSWENVKKKILNS